MYIIMCRCAQIKTGETFMKYHILHNPYAGHGTHEEKLAHLNDLYGENTTIINITEIESYQAFADTLEADDVIILCGGDGTINRFINDTDGIEIANDILYAPMGTGNDFLRDIEVPFDTEPFSIKKYIEKLPECEIRGKKYRFLNNVGFGIDGYCCEVGDKMKAESTKPVNYTAIAIKGLLFHYKPTNATVVVDGETYNYKKVWLAPTMNGRYYGGGMNATPDQKRDDPEGTLSVMLFYGKGRLATLMAFPSIFEGKHVEKKNMVAVHTGKEISVTFDSPAPVQIDGETILGITSYKAKAHSLVDTKIEA